MVSMIEWYDESCDFFDRVLSSECRQCLTESFVGKIFSVYQLHSLFTEARPS